MSFARHAGNQLKKWLGLTHDKVGFTGEYLFAEVPGKVVYRSDPDEEYALMVLRSAETIKIGRRCMVVVNPDLGKFTSYNCANIVEPGEIPTIHIHNYEGSFEEMELEWLFRFYFMK